MKVLFIDSTNKILLDLLTNSGFECNYQPNILKNEIENTIQNYEGIITRSKITFDKALIDRAIRLKFIGRVGAGMENIDTEYAESKGIKCFNSPEGNRDAVGEHALGMLLSLFNNLCIANNEVKNGFWNREKNRGFEIKGKTVGIIGYGNMGKAFAQRLSGFEANVIAYDKYKTKFSDNFVAEVSLNELFEKTDILSLHVPLTEETTFMLNRDFISKFKNPIYIINTARGKVLKIKDLIENLRSKKVLGAVLDVLEYEKKSFENIAETNENEDFKYLIESKNVMLSPHIAGWTYESDIKLAQFLAEKIIKEFT
ncbi:MAG: hypothetical protein JXR51_15325 [Bacteroidales bacterium]|nr:hypothetical protein [Bacteroidales bacterium]MBN2758542.1 hypothetical protein [Bacteroidales bacterium]